MIPFLNSSAPKKSREYITKTQDPESTEAKTQRKSEHKRALEVAFPAAGPEAGPAACAGGRDWRGLLKLSLRLELPEAPVLTSSQFLTKLFLILNGKKIKLLSAWGKI